VNISTSAHAIFNEVAWLIVTFDRPLDVQPDFGAKKIVVTESLEPLNSPAVTGPATTWVVGLPATALDVTVAVVEAFVLQTIVAEPLVLVFAPVARVVQLLAIPNLSLAVNDPLTMPPPAQPVRFALIVTVGFTFAGLASLGRAGENVAVPFNDLQTGLLAALSTEAAGEATIPSAAVAAANKSVAALRMPRIPPPDPSSPALF
jgi:hypothetical protein